MNNINDPFPPWLHFGTSRSFPPTRTESFAWPTVKELDIAPITVPNTYNRSVSESVVGRYEDSLVCLEWQTLNTVSVSHPLQQRGLSLGMLSVISNLVKISFQVAGQPVACWHRSSGTRRSDESFLRGLWQSGLRDHDQQMVKHEPRYTVL